MRNLLLGFMILTYVLPVFAQKNDCERKITGYRVLKNSSFPFTIDKNQACFFAFYVKNPHASSSGNVYDDTLWYGYYKKANPSIVYEFPKPSNIFWTSVCDLNAVSFRDMKGDSVRNVTVIGSCDAHNQIKYRFPFVFVPQGDKYILNEDVYTNLYGFIDLTVADVSAYIKNPDKQYKILRDRYKSLTLDKLLHEKS